LTKRVSHLTENEIRALEEIKRRVQACFPVHEFILFGSKARGDARPDSDIDLLIVFERELDWRETDKVIGETYEVNLTHGTLFTAHAVARSDWENEMWPGVGLKESIEEDGIVV
jgi:predicted nucleotidyltransferase